MSNAILPSTTHEALTPMYATHKPSRKQKSSANPEHHAPIFDDREISKKHLLPAPLRPAAVGAADPPEGAAWDGGHVPCGRGMHRGAELEAFWGQ